MQFFHTEVMTTMDANTKLYKKVRPFILGVPCSHYHSDYAKCEKYGMGVHYHYSMGYQGFVIDQFLDFMFVNTGDRHEDADIEERLRNFPFYIRLGEPWLRENCKLYDSTNVPEREMEHMLNVIEGEALAQDGEAIMRVVIDLEKKRHEEKEEREKQRTEYRAKRAAAREEEDQYRKFKRAMGIRRRKRKAARYSSRK